MLWTRECILNNLKQDQNIKQIFLNGSVMVLRYSYVFDLR